MEIEQVISYETKEGNKFKIRFSLFSSVGISTLIPIVDVVLISQDEPNWQNSPSTLFEIADLIKDYLKQFNVILYYYCDHAEIEMRKSRNVISPQEYRNKIFSQLLDRKLGSELISESFHIDDPINGDHFITVISRFENEKELDKILIDMKSILK
jgi:hypothetical protein